MLRAIAFALILFGYWLLLSGHYSTWLISCGIVLSVLVILFCWYKGLVDEEGLPIELLIRGLVYWAWLGWQVVLSALNVTRVVLSPVLKVSPTMVRVDASQQTSVGLTTYANSITMTPGTISVEVSERAGAIYVHALERGGAEGLADDPMDRWVTWMEGRR